MAIEQNSNNLMSLTGYFAITDKFSSNNIVDTSRNLSEKAKQQILIDIKRAEAIETKLLKRLKVDSIAELNDRMKAYSEAVCPLSGSALQKAFIGYTTMRGFDIEALKQLFKEETLQKIEEENIVDQGVIINMLLNELHTGNKKLSFSSNKIQTSTNGKSFIKLSALSKVQREVLQGAIKKYNSKNKRGPKLQPTSFELSIKEQNKGAEAHFDWQSETGFLSPSEARQISLEELEKINQKVASEIISSCGNDPYIKKIIYHILSVEPYAFFVGYNQKDITGLLGEIKAMYYLSKFLGIEEIGASIRWYGGTHKGQSGQKPHRDILLNEFGIQVKNTTLDISNNFSSYFANASMETILDSLPDVEAKEIFKSFYGSLGFNIPYYITSKGTAASGSRHNHSLQKASFLQRRENMLNMIPQIEKAFGAFASSLMYLAVEDNSELQNIDRNSLFFVAGKTFILASQILEDIYYYIMANEPKHITIKYSTKDNIVNAYNNGDYSKSINEVAESVTLTSSYNFKIPK